MYFDQNFTETIQKIYDEFHAFDAQQENRLDRLRNIEPESALFLALQVQIQQSKKILEIGTSSGYSTLWLAKAAEMTHGCVDTIEIDSNRIMIAQNNAQKLKLDHLIQFHQGDALSYLKKYDEQNASFDLILLDAERDAYVEYWQYLAQLIRNHGGVLIVDNVLSHADEVKEFIQLIQNDSNYMHTTLNVGAGLLIVVNGQK